MKRCPPLLLPLLLAAAVLSANDEAEKWYMKGNAYLAAGEYETALEQYQQAVKADPQFRKGYYKCAAACARRKMKREMLRWLEDGYQNGLTIQPLGWDNDFQEFWKDADVDALQKLYRERIRKKLLKGTCPCCGQPLHLKRFTDMYDEKMVKAAEKERKSRPPAPAGKK